MVGFGAHDVQTVFFIAKSDDKNRVDYAIHLNEHCAPTGDDAIFPYWHEFEYNPPHTHTLGMLEYVPYGFRSSASFTERKTAVTNSCDSSSSIGQSS